MAGTTQPQRRNTVGWRNSEFIDMYHLLQHRSILSKTCRLSTYLSLIHPPIHRSIDPFILSFWSPKAYLKNLNLEFLLCAPSQIPVIHSLFISCLARSISCKKGMHLQKKEKCRRKYLHNTNTQTTWMLGNVQHVNAQPCTRAC